MKISLLHPSRARDDHAFVAMCQFTDNISNTIDYEYILSMDTSDPTESHLEGIAWPDRFKLIRNDNKNVVQAANAAAKVATGDILVLMSDDFTAFRNWDIAIVDALKGKSGLLKTFDGVQKWIVTLPIMTRDYYDNEGHIYYPAFSHMFCDTYQTHKADLQKKLIIRNDIVFHHEHYSVTGIKPDSVTLKANSTWAQGEREYLKACKAKFGLGNVDIYNLSKEAKEAGHVQWLKKKLR